MNTASLAVTSGMSPLFLFHMGALAVCIILALLRGKGTHRTWLVVFPVLAAVFDLVPLFNWVPFVPTVMHLLAIILGVMGGQAVVANAQNEEVA